MPTDTGRAGRAAPGAVPAFTISAGSPSPEEIAAVTVALMVMSASGAAGEEAAVTRNRGWADRSRGMPAWATASGWASR